MESTCCNETLDCAADGQCYVCLKQKDGPEECAANPARKKMATCAATKCQTECAGSGLEVGAEPTTPEGQQPGGAAPTTKTTTSGCSTSSSNPAGIGFGGVLALAALAAFGIRRRRA
jgi:MYXO-CTERM domain-containing protein